MGYPSARDSFGKREQRFGTSEIPLLGDFHGALAATDDNHGKSEPFEQCGVIGRGNFCRACIRVGADDQLPGENLAAFARAKGSSVRRC